jgi:hypothetical protein
MQSIILMIQHFGFATKSIKGKERLRKKGFIVFDLEDM